MRIFKHKHKWEIRGVNPWGLPTYKVCLRCGVAQERINKPFEKEEWRECKRVKELDEQ
jgi:hypothetical protein